MRNIYKRLLLICKCLIIQRNNFKMRVSVEKRLSIHHRLISKSLCLWHIQTFMLLKFAQLRSLVNFNSGREYPKYLLKSISGTSAFNCLGFWCDCLFNITNKLFSVTEIFGKCGLVLIHHWTSPYHDDLKYWGYFLQNNYNYHLLHII